MSKQFKFLSFNKGLITGTRADVEKAAITESTRNAFRWRKFYPNASFKDYLAEYESYLKFSLDIIDGI